MTKIGKFKNDQARETFLRAYEALETLWPLPATTLDIQTALGSTHVRHSGSGAKTPIVLLHPIGGNGLVWHSIIEDLARDRVVYALDTIGTAGRSVQTAPLRGESDLAAWFDEVMAGLGLDRVHVVGYSHGAWHAGLVALHEAGRLASVTLIEPGGVFVKPKWSVLLKMIAFGMKGKSDKNLRKIAEWLTPGVRLHELEFALAKPALEYRMRIGWARVLKDAELRSITTPTLVMFGADTLVADPELAARRIAEHMPDAETVIYPGTGHGVLLQIPRQLTRRILEFVQQHDQLAPTTA
ncbi:alpha/beta fold hydrolase [Nocardia brasiliensis]|uniref:alpha/beta fold hydrolase n=1 Tax=Nocardia brasiliensis TaxID=37326 RepID=UPI00366C28B5